jgi:hypothetical protein
MVYKKLIGVPKILVMKNSSSERTEVNCVYGNFLPGPH